jgi:hypothetical protein
MAHTHAAEKCVSYAVTSRNSRIGVARGILCESVRRLLLGNCSINIPAATNTQATIEEPVSKQRIGKHKKIGVLLEMVFFLQSV